MKLHKNNKKNLQERNRKNWTSEVFKRFLNLEIVDFSKQFSSSQLNTKYVVWLIMVTKRQHRQKK